MFKVLVIAYYFPPIGLSGVQRTFKFIKYMPQNNWRPTVITTSETAYYAHDHSLLNEIKDKDIEVIRIQGKEINSLLGKKGNVKMPNEWIRKILNKVSNFLFIPDNKKKWSNEAYLKAKELLSKEHFDCLFVSGPPFSSFIEAEKLKKEFNIPLIVDYRDLWYGYHFRNFSTPYHSIKIKNMEYKVLKAADGVVVTNRGIKEKLMDYYKFLTFNDILIIPHGYDPEDLEKFKREPKPNKKFIITYSGLFYENITPKYFFTAFRNLLNEKPEIAANIELHLIGITRKETWKLIKKLRLESYIVDFGYLSHLEVLSKLNFADCLWMMVGRGKNADTISSGKLFEYFGMEKPLIACLPEGKLKSYSEEYKAAIITQPDDIDEIKNAIITMYNNYLINNLPKPSKEYVEKFRRDFLTEQLTKHFQVLLNPKV